MKKINVLGTSGSGKSTFAKALAKKLGYPYIEMDSIFWQDNWQNLTDDIFFNTLDEKLSRPTWVLDGNYTRTIPVKWQDVDTVIWLDFPFYLVLGRALKRATTRIITGEKLWDTNNTESLERFLSKDSIIWWTVTTYHKNKVKNAQYQYNPEFSHIRFIRITSPKEAQDFLDNL